MAVPNLIARIIAVFALLTSTLHVQTRGGEPSAEFDTANRLYEKGDYAGAVAAYQKLTTGGHASPALLFNLGNAHFKNGQIGRAIAAFRQAEQLAPRDPDIRANLKFARSAVPGSNARISGLDHALELLTLNERGWGAATALWIWFGCLALRQLRPPLKNTLRPCIVGAAILSIFFGAWFAQGLIERATDQKVVVIQPTSVVRFGPLEESQVAFNVRDGNELRLLGKKDQWFQVADTSNRSGWIPESDVAPLP